MNPNHAQASKLTVLKIKAMSAYGSPTQEVTESLLAVAERHGLVQDKPTPRGLLEDFASDALRFGLYVWVELNPEVNWRVVASDLRFMINKAMASKGIVIAYPQRDIHLDSQRPLEVRVVPHVEPVPACKNESSSSKRADSPGT